MIHSPLVGVSTWQGVAHELKAEGFAAAVPALHDTDDSGLAYWQQHAAAIQQALKSVPSDLSFHEFLLADGRFPDWRDEDLADEIPDEQLRMALESELQPHALPFWTEPIPVFAGWPDAPCAYLQFSAAYDSPAAEARAQGWVYRHFPGGHFLPLVEPLAVARALISLLLDMGGDFVRAVPREAAHCGV